MNIAIIPARGGSKRIPRKNIKDFCGKPMIAYSIQAAIDSECFDRIIVSTDDEEIAEVAKNYGAEVPFFRPQQLSNDFIGTTPVVKHAIEEIENQINDRLQYICCLYATAPFLCPFDIKNGLNLLINNDCSYAFSVTSYPFPIQRAIKLNQNGKVEMFQPEAFKIRSQDLEEAYHDAGQFYWGTRDAWLNEEVLFSSCSIPIVLPRYQVQDIDSSEDWICAELMFESIVCRRQLK